MKQQMKLKRINISLAVDKKTDPTQIVDNVEEIIRQLEQRGIIQESGTIGGVTYDSRGED